MSTTVNCSACRRVYNAAMPTCPFCKAPRAAAPSGASDPGSGKLVKRCGKCGSQFNVKMDDCPFCAKAAEASKRLPPLVSQAAKPAAAVQGELSAAVFAQAAHALVTSPNPVLQLDFAPASLAALDLFLDESWGLEGTAPGDEAWEPSAGKRALIFSFGAFVGEVLRLGFGGNWWIDPKAPGHANAVQLQLPKGLQVLPFKQLWLRFRDGKGHSLWPVFLKLKAALAMPGVDAQPDSWEKHAQFFLKVSRPDLAKPFLREAIARCGPQDASRRENLSQLLDGARQAVAAMERADSAVEEGRSAPPSAKSPPSPAQWIEKANQAASRNELQAALSAVENALQLEANSKEALLLKAKLLVKLQKHGEAAAVCDAGLAHFPNDTGLLSLKARARFEAGNVDAALSLAEEALRCDRKHSLAWYWKGRCQLSKNQYEVALSDFISARRAGSVPAEQSYFQAWALEKLGKSLDAHAMLAAYLQGTASNYPFRDEAQARLAAIEQSESFLLQRADRLASAGDTEKAIAAYAEVTAAYPNNAAALREQGVGLSLKGKTAEAMTFFERAVAADPADPRSRDYLAVGHGRLNDFARGLEVLEQGIAECAPNGMLHARRAFYLTKLGRPGEAVVAAKQGIDVDPLCKEAYLFGSDACAKLGDSAEQIRLLREFVERLPAPRADPDMRVRRHLYALEHPAGPELNVEHALRWYEKAMARLQAGQILESKTFFDHAVESDPFNGEIWFNRGSTLLRLGDLPEALASYQRARSLLGDIGFVVEGIASVLLQQGEFQKVLETLVFLKENEFHEVKLLRQKAQALMGLKRFGEALELLQGLAMEHPRDADVEVLRGEALAALERHEEALRAFDRVLELRPKLRSASGGKALSLLALGRQQEALALTEQAMVDAQAPRS